MKPKGGHKITPEGVKFIEESLGWEHRTLAIFKTPYTEREQRGHTLVAVIDEKDLVPLPTFCFRHVCWPYKLIKALNTTGGWQPHTDEAVRDHCGKIVKGGVCETCLWELPKNLKMALALEKVC